MKSIKPISLRARSFLQPVQRPKNNGLQQMIHEWRYAACALLAFNKILSALWFEDVLTYHGGENQLDEMCLLVDDIEEAAGVLSLAGYQEADPSKTSSSDRVKALSRNGILMLCPGAATDILLLSADDWHFDLRIDELHEYKYPWLPRFMDSLMAFWLSVPAEEYEDRRELMDYVADVVARCYPLNDFGQKVAKNKYASFLSREHYELHFDIVARCKNLIRQEFEHQERHAYHVRKCQQIREGIFFPKPYKGGRFYPQLSVLRE